MKVENKKDIVTPNNMPVKNEMDKKNISVKTLTALTQ